MHRNTVDLLPNHAGDGRDPQEEYSRSESGSRGLQQQVSLRCGYIIVDEDIQDLITLDDVMEEMELGPNGALVYCMEYLMENQKWLEDQLGNVGQDDYVLFDCPGQIELFTHLNVFHDLIKLLKNYGKGLVMQGSR